MHLNNQVTRATYGKLIKKIRVQFLHHKCDCGKLIAMSVFLSLPFASSKATESPTYLSVAPLPSVVGSRANPVIK